MAAPAPAPAAGGNSGPIDNNDIESWKNRFNSALGDAAGTINSKSPEHAREWSSGFFGCLSPIDACLMTYCCPCVTFGKTHHRMMKNNSMEGYEPVNTSCLMFLGSACFGLHWVLEAMQRSEIRKKYNLQGSCLTDIAVACCCVLCDLTQQDKETALREQEIASGQYKVADSMTYEHKA
jgi:Cys-rich protein (TIGR01571 family)